MPVKTSECDRGMRCGMRRRRVAAAFLAMVLAAAVIGVGLLNFPLVSTAAADPVLADSAVTISGKGTFAKLRVTVSQTQNLISQTVTVSWSGGAPTLPSSGDFGLNYLQIMQCWGDDPAGPDRTQCQYGGSDTQASPSAGTFVRTRQVNYDFVDQKETIKRPQGSNDNVFVPFWPVGTDKPTGAAMSDRNDFFDSQVTNEIPLGSTHGDGTGEQFFEVETVRQAAGLGCGDPVTAGGVTKGRSCWLVIVPRGNTEVNGSLRSGTNTDRLESSPLSQTNWDNRLVVPLDFLPVGQACPLGAPERNVIGQELAVDAVTSWQPTLCAGGGALFSYTQLSDDVTRSKVLDGTTPGLALMTNPIAPDQPPPGHPLIYAPVALSGLAIAFNVDHQPSGDASPADLQLDGQRFASMKLTPRLVAKLLTQSYQSAVQGAHDYLKNNPLALTVDPEFLDLNPEYKGFANGNKPADALVQLDGSDATSLLWSWVKADPDASAFLAGTPDKYGMAVNPNNKDLALPTSTFPRNDQSCSQGILGAGDTGNITANICTLDTHPFALDMHDAGRSAGRGDTEARTIGLGADQQTPVSKKIDRQDPGHQAIVAVVDAATATRYGLPTAELRNATGQFVAPTTASLLAGEKAMKPSPVPDVLASDPDATDPAAYPLTALSYAVTSPPALDAAAGKDYAAFLRYAAGPGQQPGLAPGELPSGLVPLPETLKAQTTAAAATIEAQAGKSAPGSPVQPLISSVVPGLGTEGAGSSTGDQSATAGPAAAAANAGGAVSAAGARGAGQTSATSSANAPEVSQQPVAGVRHTPMLPVSWWVSVVLVTTLIIGALAATSSPVMRLLGGGFGRRLRKGATPTEQ